MPKGAPKLKGGALSTWRSHEKTQDLPDDRPRRDHGGRARRHVGHHVKRLCLELGWHAQKALFVQTNNTTANQVMVYDRAWNGTLTFVASYTTGGAGATAAGATADPLASQGSLVSADHGRLLLAVNAGSNTVSLFRVRGDRLRLQQVIGSGGAFPVSIAVYRDWVYVLNAGGSGLGARLLAERRPPLAHALARTARSTWGTPTRRTTCTRPARWASPPTAAS